MNAVFLPGVELARRYYAEVVRPLLDEHAPRLVHSAALAGWGSEVLGFDSPRSADHNWGPRCQVLVGPADRERAAEIAAMLAKRLPATFLGWPARFPDASLAGHPVRHWVEVAEFGDWLDRRLGFDPRTGIALADWLATPAQVLAEMTGGEVFHDGLAIVPDGAQAGGQAGKPPGRPALRPAGQATAVPPGGLRAVRAAITWYPDDVWRYVLACQWARIGQEEAFPGRCAESGDDLGSAVVTARLARDLMRLTLLLHRRYPPYSKWLGTAFARVPGSARLGSLLRAAVTADGWADRERMLCDAYELVARMHNALRLTAPVDVSTRWFFGRPFRVIGAERFAAALRASIGAPDLSGLPLAGAADQFVDSTDALSQRPILRAAIAALLSG